MDWKWSLAPSGLSSTPSSVEANVPFAKDAHDAHQARLHRLRRLVSFLRKNRNNL